MMMDLSLKELSTMVKAGERILWFAKPNKTCFILESIFNPMLPFALVWLLFDAFFIFVSFDGFKVIPGMSYVLIGFFALHLMPVWLYLGGVLASGLKYRNSAYIVTDKAVYTSGGYFSKTYKQRELSDLTEVSIHRGIIDQMLKVGDVFLGNKQDYVVESYGSKSSKVVDNRVKIENVPDFGEVYKIVKDAQSNLQMNAEFFENEENVNV